MRKFIFLSATPDEQIKSKITNVIGADLIDTSYININNSIVDQNPIMPEVELEFHHASRFGAGDMLLKDLSWIAEFKGDQRMAIILDSAHEVAVLSDALRRNTDWDICERSGFRKDPMDKSFDVLVGNKAVEVGIDFKGDYAISRLIFSSHNLSEFLQRFGRLRNPTPGVIYKSICFVPEIVMDHFRGFDRISREQLEMNLRQTMHDPKIAENFRWRYGYLEAYEYIYKNAFGIGVDEAKIMQSGRPFPPKTGGIPSDKRDNYFAQGLDLIREHYFMNMDIKSNDILESIGFLEKTTNPEILNLMEELSSFRGNGVDMAYYDLKNRTFGTYNAFFLLKWGKAEILPRNQFKRRVPKDYHKKIDEISDRVVGYAIIRDLIEKPRYLKFSGRNLRQMELTESNRKPEKAYGLLPVTTKRRDSDDENLDLSTVINNIKSRGLFCRYLSHASKISKEFYNIDDYIVLVDYEEGSLAIGLDAIYVDCVIYDRLSSE